ncbi:TerD family protein [Kitasatospora sp. NA04385]|uniref:TerD family protein n=1 Tax=Kitasatospora sp. NA04385 TaxID=2742135 RepID=UPI00158FC934|nr:TerD family protein [Kitasatospora sp. NA04385]QKW23415.1 TerD family protein [Kitasatospora sp. NA04385]
MSRDLVALLVRHTRRLPVPAEEPGPAGPAGPVGPVGQGAVLARQFDAALMSAGFKLSGELLARLSELPERRVGELAEDGLAAVRELVGDHVRHNAYFVDFPRNVPDTGEFWLGLLAEALHPGRSAADLANGSGIDLLALPGYGTYRHGYAELLAAHEELIAGAGGRVTVLHLGDTPEQEARALYLALAGSTTPLGEEALRDLATLARHCADGPQPAAIPVRENRATVNAARLHAGSGLLADTVTDVLRTACALFDGDVTLAAPTRFGPLPRPVRRALLAALDEVVAAVPGKLADVLRHRERFKRLGERLHPHEYPKWPHAAQVFAVARGEQPVRGLDGRVEELLAAGEAGAAADLLAAAAPGKLLRAFDRLLRAAAEPDRAAVLAAAERALPAASGRLLLSLREHLADRARTGRDRRVFVNRDARSHVTDDLRPPLPAAERDRLAAALDAETARRLPADPPCLLVDPEILDVALPLSGNASATGIGVLPRGSVQPVRGELLRFFVYWKQHRRTTDFDLSALMLDESYDNPTWLSYTELSSVAGEHSGDIVEAPEGASEFINLRLSKVPGAYIVPQVNVYAGEGFQEVEESFFGWMLREDEQQGRPFEPRTVRMKSDLRGAGRVALPLVFERRADGAWYARWLHVHLRGEPAANRVETNRTTVADLLRAAVGREHLTVRHLVGLMTANGARLLPWDAPVPDGPVTYLGLARPEGLPEGSRVITPENLRELIPA